jgi:hypothetical protein
MSSKQQVTIYKLDIDYIIQEFDLPANTAKDTIISRVMNEVEDARKKLKPIPLSVQTIKELNVKMFFAKISNDWDWPNFFEGKVDETNDEASSFVNSKKMHWLNLVCFFYNGTSIYAICAGLGHHYIADYSEEFFGMSILERIANKENISFSMLRNRSVIGDVAFNSRVFRNKQNVWNEDVLGKIYGGANFSLNNLNISDPSVKALLQYDHSGKQKKSINITATNGIKFNRMFNLTEIATLIKYLDTLNIEKFSFSLIRSLAGSKKKNDKLKEKLNNNLSIQIYSYFESLKNSTPFELSLFEFAHKRSMDFYSATEIIISRDTNIFLTLDSPYGISIKYILDEVYDRDKVYIDSKIDELDLSNADHLKKWNSTFSRYRVEVKNDSQSLIKERIGKFLFGEIALENKKYFYLDEKWFRTVDTFLNRLNQDTKSLINQSKLDLSFDYEWGEDLPEGVTDGEDYYLRRLQDKAFDDQYVMHKIMPTYPNIEFCDILQFDNSTNTTYLCHLKPKFQGEMRTLAAQVLHATKLLIDYHQSGNDNILKSYYDQAVNYTGNNAYKLSAKTNFASETYETFKALFGADRKIVFVAAICDESRDVFGDMDNFDSTIAKLATFDLIRYMMSLTTSNIQFKIMQF